MIATIAAIAFLVMLSALMSGSETAMTGSSPARIHHLVASGSTRAKLVERLLRDREKLIGALLIANNIVNILSAALATNLLVQLTGEAGVAYATIVMTVMLVIFGEVLPKTLAIRNPEHFALRVAPAVRAVVALAWPAVKVVGFIVDGILHLVRPRGGNGSEVSAADVLRGTLALVAGKGGMRKHEHDMLGAVLDLERLTVDEVITHRRDMVSINADAPVEEIVKQVLEAPYTRYPMWRGDPDTITGVLHAKDVVATVHRKGAALTNAELRRLASPPWFVPDTTSLLHQLLAFRQRRAHLAFVVDEYGALMGLVTLEDILEEIVGDIVDEKDVEVSGVQHEADGALLVEGRVTVRDLNRQFDWNLPDEEATTLAGLLIHEARRIPDVGENFLFHGFRFEVLRRQRHQLTLLRIRPQAVGQDEG
jgi:Mg2+/Co2+ transporter CorB